MYYLFVVVFDIGRINNNNNNNCVFSDDFTSYYSAKNFTLLSLFSVLRQHRFSFPEKVGASVGIVSSAVAFSAAMTDVEEVAEMFPGQLTVDEVKTVAGRKLDWFTVHRSNG